MAAASGWFYDESFICSTSASLVAGQFTIVGFSTGSTIQGRLPIITCVNTSGNVAQGVGVLQDTPAVNRAGSVRLLGITKLVATTSAAVTAGAQVTCNALGQGMVADTSGQTVYGRALSGSTGLVAGSEFDLLLTGPVTLTLL